MRLNNQSHIRKTGPGAGKIRKNPRPMLPGKSYWITKSELMRIESKRDQFKTKMQLIGVDKKHGIEHWRHQTESGIVMLHVATRRDPNFKSEYYQN